MGELRTEQQNKAIHVFCRDLANALNEAGFDVTDGAVLHLPVSWTESNVKELIWKPVQRALYPKKRSTTQLEKKDVNEVFENITRAIGERTGVTVPFPSEDNDE